MIVYQISGYYPPHLGGIEFCAQNIAKQLAKTGHDVTVLTSTVGNGRAHIAQTDKLHVRYLRGFEFAHTPFVPGLIRALWQAPRKAIIHVHLAHIAIEVPVWLVAMLQRRSYVAHFHMQGAVSGPLGFIFTAYQRTLLPIIMRRAARVIVLSDDQATFISKQYKVKSENVTVIPNGVGDEFFLSPRTARKAPVTQLLYVGRFAEQKNVPRLLQALPLISEPVHLHLVGSGEKQAELMQLSAELGLKNVTFHGPQTGETLIKSYAQADMFILPSNNEGMPLALLEAMAAGLTVVASDVSGLREHVAGRGVLVFSPSPQNFATAINRLIARPAESIQLGQIGQTWARDFKWSLLVKRVVTTYHEATS